MGHSSQTLDLLDLLQDVFSQHGVEEAIRRFSDDGWTLATAASAYLELCGHLFGHASQVPSLQSASRKKLTQILSDDAGYEENAPTVLKCLQGRPELRNLLRDPCIPYRLLRRLCSSHAGLSIDLEDAVRQNHAYICGARYVDEHDYLVTAEQLIDQLGMDSPLVSRDIDSGISLYHLHAPDSHSNQGGHGFTITDSQGFIRLLHNIGARDLIKSLPWDNLLMAGESVAEMFLNSQAKSSPFRKAQNLDLFILNEDAQGANQLVQSIWTSAIAQNGFQQARMVRDLDYLVIKNGSAMWRIRVFLGLFRTRKDVLGLFDTRSEIGFDGERLIMLPRCAFALETGLPTLAPELVLHKRPVSLPDHLEIASDMLYYHFLRPEICDRLGLASHSTSGFNGYLHRRIRCSVCMQPSNDNDYERRQIAIPVPISHSLEAVITECLENPPGASLCEHGIEPSTLAHPTLLPVYNPEYHNTTTLRATAPSIPPLPDSTDPDEDNLRFWIVSHTGMWRGQHPVVDEAVEIIGCLIGQVELALGGERSHLSQDKIIPVLLRHFGRRLLALFHKTQLSSLSTALHGRLSKMGEAFVQAWRDGTLLDDDVDEEESSDEDG